MAVQTHAYPNPSNLSPTLEWMQSQIPDRYWESPDAATLLRRIGMTSVPPPEYSPWRMRPAFAVAQLVALDRENDTQLREQGSLVAEPDLFRLA